MPKATASKVLFRPGPRSGAQDDAEDQSNPSSLLSKDRMNPLSERMIMNTAKRHRHHRRNIQKTRLRETAKDTEPTSSRESLFGRARNVTVNGGQFNIIQSTIYQSLEDHDIEFPGNTNNPRCGPAMENFSPMWDLPRSPIRRGYEIYYQHLAAKGRGSPLWLPEPSSTLPDIYRRQGISIGDVGIITKFGSFDFMFNICLPADHPINQQGLPESFSPLFPPLCPSDIHKYLAFRPNSYLASASVKRSSREIDPSGITFESSASEGAILIMPDGAHTEAVTNTSQFRRYLSANAESWYRYVIDIRGREARNGDVRLVVGCDKASSWGMATFSNSSAQDFHLTFKATDEIGSGHSSGWEGSGVVETRSGPDPEEIEELRLTDDSGHSGVYKNQCLFMRTLNCTLHNDVWQKLGFGFEMPMDKTDSYLNANAFSPDGSIKSSVTNERGL